LVAVLLALSAVAATTAFAASLTITASKLTVYHRAASCAASTVTVSADADSYVDQNSANSNFGSASDLKVKAPLLSAIGINLGGERWTVVHFTLPATPDLCVVAAKLRLFASTSVGGRTLEARGLATSWTEGTVTWTNLPTPTGTGVTTSSAAGYREWTVTSLYSVAANGFVVRDSTGASLLAPEQLYNTRLAASNKPELVITYS
jgi:hypothetical protein